MVKAFFHIMLMSSLALAATAAEYSWASQQAKVLPGGDLHWAPQPFQYREGSEVRYIDFENGNDANDGLSKDSPWKHHPWDLHAEGKAKAEHGVVTYVFKGGVIYRGVLANEAQTGKSGSKGTLFGESGEPGDPIRLTRDPSWGDGPAYIFGSIRLPSEWQQGGSVPYPERMPETDKVWGLDLKALGVLTEEGKVQIISSGSFHGVNEIRMPFLGLHRIDAEGDSHMQHLARTPDWQPGNENFVLDYWHKMDGQYALKDGKKLLEKGIQDDFLQGHPQDYFTGGFIWPQYGHFMGGAMPREITAETKTKQKTMVPMYDPEHGAIFTGCYGQWAADLRYMIDNLPQYLDSAEEFYFDQDSGYLFYRPIDGQDPNDLQLEWTRYGEGVSIDSQKHIEISGLEFRYQSEVAVNIYNDCEDIRVSHCRFEDILNKAVSQGMKNWRSDKDDEGNIRPRSADNIVVTDCDFQDIWTTALHMSAEQEQFRVLGHIEVLRNNFFNTGIRHKDNVQTPLPCVEILYPRTGDIAGNIVEDSWGSGLLLFAGIRSRAQVDWPLSRLLVHHNKTVDTALAVNDYGGMSLWQGGPMYCYNNNIGNSPGVMPAGITMFGGRKGGMNLSYPLYLDGAYKIYSFNNIIWARSNDKSEDQYATSTPGYFMVFGFLNHLVNNTLYRTGKGVGGSSGHRNDVLGNLMVDIKGAFIAHDRSGDPSLVGGGDDGSSARRGVPTLAYGYNVMHGTGEAGRLLKPNEPLGIPDGIQAKEVDQLAEMMRNFPIRYPQLGKRAEQKPIIGKQEPGPIADISEADFRPSEGSAAIDYGVTYFIPWALYGCVGEWHFTENHADPSTVIDYAWYQSPAHYERNMYEFVPTYDLRFNEASLETYVEAPSEDWCRGAMVFDGSRFAKALDDDMRRDFTLPVVWTDRKGKQQVRDIPDPPWIAPEPIDGRGRRPKYADDAVATYPAELLKTPIIRVENLLVEATLRVDQGHSGGGIAGKHDGSTGYRLLINEAGKAELQIAGGGASGAVATDRAINDGQWHHVLAEVDRASGRMTIYLDGRKAGETSTAVPADASLDNQADFLVGKTVDDAFFQGAIDFLRVCRGTLEEARTDIDELYAWQTDGPSRYDYCGNAPEGGRRDAGAIEAVNR